MSEIIDGKRYFRCEHDGTLVRYEDGLAIEVDGVEHECDGSDDIEGTGEDDE